MPKNTGLNKNEDVKTVKPTVNENVTVLPKKPVIAHTFYRNLYSNAKSNFNNYIKSGEKNTSAFDNCKTYLRLLSNHGYNWSIGKDKNGKDKLIIDSFKKPTLL